MSDKKIKIVVIDDNADRRNRIQSLLPDYAEVCVTDFGNNAMSLLRPEADGRIPKLVIINADDTKGMGLYTFDWIKNKEASLADKSIQVILLIEDEFSDRALDFLEIGDAEFFEGDVEDPEFFSLFANAIETETEEAYIPEPVYTEEKSAERLIGKRIVAPAGSEDKPQRSVLLNLEEQLENLEATMERGREKAENLRRIMAEVATENTVSASSTIKPIRVLDKRREELNKPRSTSWNSTSSRKKTSDALNTYLPQDDESDIPEEFRLKHNQQGKTAPPNQFTVKSSPLANSLMYGTNMQSSSEFYRNYEKAIVANAAANNAGGEVKKRGKIVVVDDDYGSLRTAKLFLSSQFEVILCDTGMKAIDYFVRDKADVLLIDAVMPNLDGTKTLASIRMQRNGSDVPAVFLIGRDFTGTRESLAGKYVCGTIPKPLTRANLLTAVEQVLSYKK